MAIVHEIAGVKLPQTRNVAEVLADKETTVRAILSLPTPPPSIERLILLGKVRYAYEPKNRDDYLLWPDWPIVPRAHWDSAREHLWEEYGHQISVGKGIPTSPDHVAIDDCDGFATHGVAWHRSRGRRAWGLVQQFESGGSVPPVSMLNKVRSFI